MEQRKVKLRAFLVLSTCLTSSTDSFLKELQEALKSKPTISDKLMTLIQRSYLPSFGGHQIATFLVLLYAFDEMIYETLCQIRS